MTRMITLEPLMTPMESLETNMVPLLARLDPVVTLLTLWMDTEARLMALTSTSLEPFLLTFTSLIVPYLKMTPHPK